MKKHGLILSLSFLSLTCNAAFDHPHHEASNAVKAKAEYDISKASCRMMTQGLLSKDWAAFDDVIGIPKNKQLPRTLEENGGGTVLVHTNHIDLHDIIHFFASVNTLRTAGYTPIIAMRKPFMILMQSTLDDYGITQVPEGTPTETDYETHLISLLGHCMIEPKNPNLKQPTYRTLQQEILRKLQNIPELQGNVLSDPQKTDEIT